MLVESNVTTPLLEVEAVLVEFKSKVVEAAAEYAVLPLFNSETDDCVVPLYTVMACLISPSLDGPDAVLIAVNLTFFGILPSPCAMF